MNRRSFFKHIAGALAAVPFLGKWAAAEPEVIKPEADITEKRVVDEYNKLPYSALDDATQTTWEGVSWIYVERYDGTTKKCI